MPFSAFSNICLFPAFFLLVSFFYSPIILADHDVPTSPKKTISATSTFHTFTFDALPDTLITPVTAMLYDQQYDMEHFGYDKRRKKKKRKSISLKLTGLALSANYELLTHTKVVLLDKITKGKQEFMTKEDGEFYFKLKPNRKYAITIQKESGNTEVLEIISTFNKKKSETIHKVLKSME